MCVTQRLRVSLPGSFPNKQKSSDSSTAAMTSALGSNLSELDRLLLELNAVQQSSPSFATSGMFTPPQPQVLSELSTLSCASCVHRGGGPPLTLLQFQQLREWRRPQHHSEPAPSGETMERNAARRDPAHCGESARRAGGLCAFAQVQRVSNCQESVSVQTLSYRGSTLFSHSFIHPFTSISC